MNRISTSDKYEYINEESINERLKCIICTNPFIDPVKTKCKPKEHTFCHYCIRDWLQRDSSCPSCRQHLKIQDLIPITEGILLDMLNELPVQCLVCKKSGLERGNYDEHVNKQCLKNNILCSSADIKCPWIGSQKQLEEHLKTCPYTILRPMLSQIIADEKQLKEQIDKQQILIDQLQRENQHLKKQIEQRKISMSRPPPTGNRSIHEQKRSRENTSASSTTNNRPMPTPKVSCNNCPDCWSGAVRGSYFRGPAGGGFQPGTTLLPCQCNCHK